MEWEVWLDDGRRITSMDMPWGDWGDHTGVLVERHWDVPIGDGINWGDGLYGRPNTLKAAGMTDDATFDATLSEAKASRVRPSER